MWGNENRIATTLHYKLGGYRIEWAGIGFTIDLAKFALLTKINDKGVVE